MVMTGPSPARVRNVCPTTLAPGQYRRALAPFTIATRGASGPSVSVKARPATIGPSIVSKYPGDTLVPSPVGPGCSAGLRPGDQTPQRSCVIENRCLHGTAQD